MEAFKPIALKIAREVRGYTHKELAWMFGYVAENKIHAFESGQEHPNEQEVKRLSEVLKFPIGFFAKDMVEIEAEDTFICSYTGEYCLCGNSYGYLCDHVMDNGQTCDAFLCDECAYEVEKDTHFCREHAEYVERLLSRGYGNTNIGNIYPIFNVPPAIALFREKMQEVGIRPRARIFLRYGEDGHVFQQGFLGKKDLNAFLDSLDWVLQQRSSNFILIKGEPVLIYFVDRLGRKL